jgi:hypothetical protein
MAAPEGNQYALGNNGGAPRKYSDPDELEKKVIEYFEWIEGEQDADDLWVRFPEAPTITGLALFLGFSTKTTLYEYAKREEFANSIKRALLVVENNYEKGLQNDRCTGIIFALKNMGWEDNRKVTMVEEQPLFPDETDDKE